MSGPTAPPAGSQSRPDASMSLLVDLMTRDALDRGYAEAAARRSTHQPTGTAAGLATGWAPRVLAVALVGLLIGLGAVSLHSEAPSVARATNQLRTQVEARLTATDRLAEQVTALQAQTAKLRDRDLAASTRGEQAASAVQRLELAAGASPVTGPGMTVTLNNAPAPVDDPLGDSGPTSVQLGTVLDSDVQSVVNALWAAGAEAVAISGQRLSALSAIRSAGSAILVDFRPLNPPYVISAIGDPRTLEANFADSKAARTLHSLSSAYGLQFSVDSADSVTLPAAGGLMLHRAHRAQLRGAS